MGSARSCPLRCTADFHGFTNLFSHGFDHPTKPASNLVEQRHLFLRNAPCCGIRCLPSSPVYRAWGSPRRNHCALSVGNVWVRISILGAKTSPLMEHKRITIGYHRLYSHRAFNASFGVRAVLALTGASAFQGSIKVRPHLRLVYAIYIELASL